MIDEVSGELQSEHSGMVLQLAKSGEDIIKDMTPDKAHLLHMVIGMAGEATEIIEALVTGDRKNLIEELGDYEFYIEGSRGVLRVNRNRTLDLVAMGKNEGTQTVSAAYDYGVKLSVGTGNLLDLIKKYTIYDKPVSMAAIVDSFNIIEQHIDAVRWHCNISRAETLRHNLHKLLKGKTARYKEGSYSNKQAIDRADKA